jgi:hypothetical protein
MIRMSRIRSRGHKRVLIGMLGCPVLMQWAAPTTGIAMCPIPTALEERREFAVGYTQTF